MGIYNSDGGWLVTVVGANDAPVGLYAPDGSYRVTTDVGLGVYAPNGSLRINDTTTAYTAYNANGALNGQLLGSVFYPSYQNNLFVDAALTLFNRMTVEPDLTRKRHINTLISSLQTAGIWDKLDVFYVMAAHDSQAARLNWKSSSFTLTPVASPVFTANQGYAGNGSTSYLDTGYNAVTAGGVYALNSAHQSIWSRTNSQETAGLSLGARSTATTNQVTMLLRNVSDLGVSRTNQDSNSTGVSVTDSRGFFIGSRLISTSQQFFRNGVQLSSFSVSTAIPNFSMFIGGVNQGGALAGANASARQHSICSFGSGLTPTESLNFYNAVNTYMAAIGAA